jgi:cytidylate kinase
MQNGYIAPDFFDKETLVHSLPFITLEFKFNAAVGFAEMYLNDVNVEKEIRTIKVSGFVSKVAEIDEVRTKLVEQQQEMGKNKGIVMDGRDIGTVVFPDAELKYSCQLVQLRAQRRYDELIAKGDKVTYEAVLKNVEERDYIDSNRANSPLIKAENAIEIDNSNLTRDEQFEMVLALVNEAVKKA